MPPGSPYLPTSSTCARSPSLPLFPSPASMAKSATAHHPAHSAPICRNKSFLSHALRTSSGSRCTCPQFMLDALGGSIRACARSSRASAARRIAAPALELASKTRGLAVVDLERDGKVVCACDAAAAAAGIAPGMALNSALALLPALHTLARDPQRERELLVALAEWALRFTPARQPRAAGCRAARSARQPAAVRRLAQARANGCARNCARRASSRGFRSRRRRWRRSGWRAPGREGVIRHRGGSREPSCGSAAPLHPLARTQPGDARHDGRADVGDCLRLPRDGFARRFEPRDARHARSCGRPAAGSARGFVSRERFAAGRDLEPEIADTARL